MTHTYTRTYSRKRHRDFEAYDEIHMKVIPRFKTSGLSGDEWRVSVKVELMFKGKVIHERVYGDMRTVLELLPHAIVEYEETGKWYDGISDIEEESCDQPGCPKKSVSIYVLKKEYSRDGSFEKDPSVHSPTTRKFCEEHLQRGNCGLEDSDSNYEVIDGPGPDDHKMKPSSESPSGFVTT